jgi:hypothetical protein
VGVLFLVAGALGENPSFLRDFYYHWRTNGMVGYTYLVVLVEILGYKELSSGESSWLNKMFTTIEIAD